MLPTIPRTSLSFRGSGDGRRTEALQTQMVGLGEDQVARSFSGSLQALTSLMHELVSMRHFRDRASLHLRW